MTHAHVYPKHVYGRHRRVRCMTCMEPSPTRTPTGTRRHITENGHGVTIYGGKQ